MACELARVKISLLIFHLSSGSSAYRSTTGIKKALLTEAISSSSSWVSSPGRTVSRVSPTLLLEVTPCTTVSLFLYQQVTRWLRTTCPTQVGGTSLEWGAQTSQLHINSIFIQGGGEASCGAGVISGRRWARREQLAIKSHNFLCVGQ